MAGRKLPVLPDLGGFPDPLDLGYVVDVSDTSESPQGTSKQFQWGEILKSGTYTPTVTDESSCTVSLPPDAVWYWTKIGDIVTVNGIGIMTLDALGITGSAYISLPVAPANDWSSYYQLGGTVNVYELSTGDLGDFVKSVLTTDPDTPSKRLFLSIGIEPAFAGDQIIFGVSFSYSVNN